MSRKHVDEYYNQICAQYKELLENTKEVEKSMKEGIVSPEFLDNYKKVIEPVKVNYERWSYMIFLLNMPNKKEKKRKYLKQREKEIDEYKNKQLDKIDLVETKEAILEAKKFV